MGLFYYKLGGNIMKIVFCNCPENKAQDIAKKIVIEKLAACVNVSSPIKSFYYWDGKLCEDSEVTLMIKIRKEAFLELQKRIEELHPYDVPEIISINVEDSNKEYIKWVYEMTEK